MNTIKQMRHLVVMTRRELAEASDLTVYQLDNIESGRRDPTDEELESILLAMLDGIVALLRSDRDAWRETATSA